ncbi:MAG TPA: helix-turn-helix transcriptional regulator [Methylocella sp.]|nr:helix-turn-helix transcriptional regulator [Methylocella sp.]
MSRDNELETLVELIYDAALDNELWPSVVTRLADLMGVPQVAMPCLNRRANIFATIAPRVDPDLLASYKDYWAFHDPVLARATRRPAGEICTVDSLMPREEFASTPVFNEFWRLAQYGLETTGANLLVEDQFSALICFSNAPGKDSVTAEQTHIFKALLPHFTRALRINRRLWYSEFKHMVTAERLETLQQGALLADVSARVAYANATARAMLDDGGGIFLDNGRLAATEGSEILQKAIALCARTSSSFDGPGEFEISRELPQSPIHVMVTPLSSKARLAKVPWIGHGAPVAIVSVSDPDMERRRQKNNLRCRFGLSEVESGVAVEILKGHGRRAAARRLGISDTTAKRHLASIFEKTGTHRQAELVHLLLDAADGREAEISLPLP